MQFIDLSAQYRLLKSKIDRRINKVLEHGQYILGPEVLELEESLSEYVGVKHAITCANGTDALQLSLMAMGIGKGDVVFCPTFTFFATAEVIALIGAKPVFVDSDSNTFNICPLDLESKIQSAQEKKETPRAIISVDLFGLPADYIQLRSISQKYGLLIIEDSAQGFGGAINGKRAGSFGDISTTSFFPAKPLGCYGDGGAIFTDDDNYAEILKSLRVHGKGKDKYDNVRIGLNSRLDTIQAAILLEKLEAFPYELEKRNELALFYSERLGSRFKVPTIPPGYYSSWAQYTIQTNERDGLASELERKGIPTMVYYRTCVHQQSAFVNSREHRHDCPRAEALSKSVLSLPMHPYMDMVKLDEALSLQ